VEGVTMERRIQRVESKLGGGDDCGPLTIIAPNSWSDADRAAWEAAEIRHGADAEDALIERYAGHPVRPCRAHRPHCNVIVVPAPASVEGASEEERAAWRQRGSARHPWRA
jgi:hypothetical protein